jgi:hypothetical protein
VAVTNGGTGVGSLTGLVKGNGTSAFTAALSGTDYAPATSGTAILYGNGSGGFSSVSIGTNLTFTGGTLSATGASATFISSLSSTNSLSATNGLDQLVLANSTLTVHLFASSTRSGYQVTIKNLSVGTITIDGNASETIDGATTQSIPVRYGALQLICDGANWHIV